jgi:hypothetical protein
MSTYSQGSVTTPSPTFTNLQNFSFHFLFKRWDPVFYKRRLFRKRDTCSEIASPNSSEGNGNFKGSWVESEEDAPHLQRIKELCSEVSLRNLQNHSEGSDDEPLAWLEDRQYVPDDSRGWLRLYSKISPSTPRLTASTLYEYLSQKVQDS